MAGQALDSKGAHPLLVQSGTEGMPQDMGTQFILIDVGHLQVFTDYAIDISTAEVMAVVLYEEAVVI